MRFFDMTHKAPAGELPLVPDGRRARTVQRLQIGLTGITLMVMLVGLASIVQDKARAIDAVSVPGAAATTEPSDAASGADPLVEAGVVPDLAPSATADASLRARPPAGAKNSPATN